MHLSQIIFIKFNEINYNYNAITVGMTPTTKHCLIPMLRSMVVNLVILTPTTNHCINLKVRGQGINLVIQRPTPTWCKIPQVRI